MPKLTKRQVDNLIRGVADSALSMKVREKKLAELEQWAKAGLKSSQRNFDDALKSIDKQLSTFEENYALFDRLASPVDDADVDTLMAQIQDEVRLEQMTKSQERQQDAALMKRLQELKGNISSVTNPEKSGPEQDAELRRRLDALKDNSPSPSATERSGAEQDAELRRRLDALKDSPQLTETKIKPEDSLLDEARPKIKLDDLVFKSKQFQQSRPQEPSSEPNNPQADKGNTTASKLDTRKPAPASPVVVPTESSQPSIMMSSLPDTQDTQFEDESSIIPSEANSMPELMKPEPESTGRLESLTLNIKEQIEQITKQLSPEEQKVLNAMSSGKNDNYTLELATLIQQRENISAKARAANQKDNPADEDIAAKLQAEELEAIFQPKNP